MQSALRKHLLHPFRAAVGLSNEYSLSPQPGAVGSSRLVQPLGGAMRGAAATSVCLPYRPAGYYGGSWLQAPPPPVALRRLLPRRCDVFINHRGADTKKTLAALLYDRLSQLKVRAFLDNRSMNPGDKLFETIDSAIRGCKVGIVIFSPRYCESYFCLHELSLMVEWQKKVIPIFCDVSPSDLLELKDGQHPAEDLERFRRALREVKYTVGFTFDSQNGYARARTPPHHAPPMHACSSKQHA
ncbi:hypothetical protein Taro_012761 [Colocasia esculenta]|uniref:TIR domain-containing protein n=1 Tax=Colocasia esculenta TaxID=4460 RepID=A0A843UA11_COLES|nr:hypothetical protein [Colocasia esculenta]